MDIKINVNSKYKKNKLITKREINERIEIDLIPSVENIVINAFKQLKDKGNEIISPDDK